MGETKRILITGGLGFLGSNISKKLLNKGHEVHIVDCSSNHRNIWDMEDELHITQACIANDLFWQKECKDKDAIIHLAANVSHILAEEDPHLDVNFNIIGTINLAEGVKKLKNKPRILYACSRSMYGYTPMEALPIDESWLPAPLDGYGISKLAGEKYLLKYAHHHDMPVVSFRMSNLVGPRQGLHTRAYQMISWIFRCVSRDETIGFWGDGLQSRDFLYVGDAADAYVRVATSDEGWDEQYPHGDFFNLPGGEYSTWLKAIQTCGKVLGKSPKVQFEEYPNRTRVKLENRHSNLNGTKVDRRFNIRNETQLSVAFKKMAEYYPGRWEDYLHEGVLG